MDSKKMTWDVLCDLAQSNLFTSHLSIMDRYLNTNRWDIYKNILDETKENLDMMHSEVSILDTSRRKLKVVDGQVIVVKKSEVPLDTTPEQYIRENWDIPSNANLKRIGDCMLRGVCFINQEPTIAHGNQTVVLDETNMPPHMHHSAVTSGSIVRTLNVDDGGQMADVASATRYDIFQGDSVGVGLTNNELDGVGTSYEVEETGSDETEASSNKPVLTHDNLPAYEVCYAFEVDLTITNS